MPSINISQTDFEAVALAAHRALDSGDREQADALDKIARKINASLSNTHIITPFGKSKGLSWQEVPSVFEHRS